LKKAWLTCANESNEVERRGNTKSEHVATQNDNISCKEKNRVRRE
jgi:hypothetical protein